MSSELVPYRAPSTSTTVITTSTRTSSLVPSRFFTAQAGHALATELLYRLLYDLLNRLLVSLHRFASKQVDTFSSFLERKYVERQAAQKSALEEARRSLQKPGISEAVEKAAVRRGFVHGKDGVACPLTGSDAGVSAPPGWVGQVLVGIEEGRLVEKDFWGHPFGN